MATSASSAASGSWLKVSASWECNPAGCGKIHFLFAPTGGDTYMGIYCPPDASNPYGSCGTVTQPSHFVTGGQLQFSAGAGSNYPLGIPILPNVTTTPLYRDRWHHLAAYYRWSTSKTAADGIWRWWIDGTLNGEYTDIVYSLDPAIEFQFAMTKQKVPNPPDQFVWFDQTIVRAPGGNRNLQRSLTPRTP